MGKKSREKHRGLTFEQRASNPEKSNPNSSLIYAFEKFRRKTPYRMYGVHK
jgi:hypothetical protein